MKKWIILILICILLPCTVYGEELAPPEVPEEGELYMPEDTDSFSEAVWYVIRTALKDIAPDLVQASKTCFSLFGITILLTVAEGFTTKGESILGLVGTLLLGITLLSPTRSLINQGSEVITQMTEYSKMLLPVMTSALAAQGGVTTSAALYAGSSFFIAVLATLVTKVSVPLLYVYFCLSLSKGAFPNEMLEKLQKFFHWGITWSVKIILYIFIGYMSITGVVSGTADASAVRAMKLTLGGMVPVVGGILSEASETVLVSAGVVKNAAGIYGAVAVLALVAAPFLKIGAQYLMLNLTCGISSMISEHKQTSLLKEFATGMGLLLAMVGSVCLLILISTVCFMKGMS